MGLAAAFFVVAKESDAQVVYTDVDPDAILTNTEFDIDFDNDGMDDLRLSHLSFGTAGGFFQVNAFGQIIRTSSYSPALPAGAIISLSNNFVGGGVLACGFNAYGGFFSTYGNWVGQDAYLGCRFTSGGGTVHYAWVHLMIDTLVSSVVVMGYAYETIPGLAIVAGNQGGPAAVADLEGPARLEVFPNPVKDLTTVRFGEALQGQVTVQVLDGIGRILQEHATAVSAERSMTLDLGDLPTGTYFVAVRSGERIIHRTVTKVN